MRKAAALVTALGLHAGIAHGCDEPDPERLRCSIPERVPITIHIDDRVGMEPAVREHGFRLVREALGLHGIDITYSNTPVEPGKPDQLTVRYVHFKEFAQSCVSEGITSKPQTLRGYANVRERTAYDRATAQILFDESMCPAGAALGVATVTLHEIGHLLGVPHPEDIPGSDIPLNGPDGRWNAMMQGVPIGGICDQDPATLEPRDILSDLDPKQARMMRDAASSGSLWRRMIDAGFDYDTYVMRFAQDVAQRTNEQATINSTLKKPQGSPEANDNE